MERTADHPKLNPAPIIEAVMCVDFAGLPSLTKDSAVALMTETDNRYVWRDDLLSHSWTFDSASPTRAITPESLWTGSRFSFGDCNVTSLTNLDPQIVRCSYSRIANYESWETFSATSQGILNQFVNAQHKDPVVRRIGVRFINRIVLPNEKCTLKDILLTAPRDPIGVSNIIMWEFFSRDTCRYEEFKLDATTIKRSGHDEVGKPSLIVDFDVFDNPAKEYSTIDWASFQNRARDLKNALFFGSVNKNIYKEWIA